MSNPERSQFTAMADGTAEDYARVAQWSAKTRGSLVESVLAMLEHLKDEDHGYQVDRYVHSLQTATLAYEDGADEETIVAAVLHDIGDPIAPENHSELAAAVLRPYVSEKTHWIVLHHGVFQGYYFWHHYGLDRNARDAHRGNPYYQACVDWCHKYDQRAFDPTYVNKPLEFFEPMVRRIFARKPWAALGRGIDGREVVASEA